MKSNLNQRQTNYQTTSQRLILDQSEVVAQPPKNPNQKSSDYNRFFNNRDLYRS